jgi:hypothetical protein
VPNQQLEPPTLSEIARRLDEMREDLRSYAKEAVALTVYQADNIARDREAKEMKADIAALQVKVETEHNDRVEAEAVAARAREEARSRNVLMWVTIFATPAVTLLVTWIASGGLAHVGT